MNLFWFRFKSKFKLKSQLVMVIQFLRSEIRSYNLHRLRSNQTLRSDGYSYNITISALCRSRQYKEARQLAKDFEANFTKYDLFMINTLLRVYCNSGDMDSAMQIMRKMDELAIAPDWNTFHILVKYYCKERLYILAYKVIEDMHGKGHHLDEDNSELYRPLHGEVCDGIHEAGNINSINDVLKAFHRSGCKLYKAFVGKGWTKSEAGNDEDLA